MNKNGNITANQNIYPFILPALPYSVDALEPYMSSKTFSYHHGKHHAAYVNNLNKLLENHELANNSLEDIILASASDNTKVAIFNNAAQVWNHTFFWHCLSANGGGVPNGSLYTQIINDFGSFEKFCDDFKAGGATQFGSGWVWLVWDGAKLTIEKTANADLPLVRGKTAILTCDVWEHAYYLDYQNARPDYLAIFLTKLANWEFAQRNFAGS